MSNCDLNPIYVYDGSFDGLLSCVFDVFDRKETPSAVVREYGGFLECRNVLTSDEKVERVKRGIISKMGRDALRTGENAFLSEREGIEKQIVEYFALGFRAGKALNSMLWSECVSAVQKAARYTLGERHRIIQFLRFSDSCGVLTSVISPEANILPLIAGHFAERFPRESFLIYDNIRRMALVCDGGRRVILPLEEYAEPDASEEERRYRELFKTFYDTIEIKERHNERCRMSQMPKRFWKNMTEFGSF